MSEQIFKLMLVNFVNENNINCHYRGIRNDAAEYCGVRINDGLFNRVFNQLSF